MVAGLLQLADASDLHASLCLVLAIRSTELDVAKEEPWLGWLQRADVSRLDVGPLQDEAARRHPRRTEHPSTCVMGHTGLGTYECLCKD